MIRMTKIYFLKTLTLQRIDKDVKQLEFLFIIVKNAKYYSHFGSLAIPYQVKYLPITLVSNFIYKYYATNTKVQVQTNLHKKCFSCFIYN